MDFCTVTKPLFTFYSRIRAEGLHGRPCGMFNDQKFAEHFARSPPPVKGNRALRQAAILQTAILRIASRALYWVRSCAPIFFSSFFITWFAAFSIS